MSGSSGSFGSRPEVCVIIPVFNRAGLIGRTLDSILGQTLPPVEIIVIDDHSTDGIEEALLPYRDRIVFRKNEGKGPGAARNLGMRMSKAPIVHFFDSDDLLTRDKIEAQARMLIDQNLDMVYGPYFMASETAQAPGWQQVDVIMQRRALPSPDLLKWILRGWNIITQACLFRREFLERCPPWDSDLITYEDYLYLFRLGLSQPRIGHCPEGAVLYRQHGGQSTLGHTQAISRSRDKIEVMRRMQQDAPWNRLDFVTKRLFDGRFSAALEHHITLESLEKQPIADGASRINKVFNQIHNKFERLKTGTAWETMHGVDKDPGSFDALVRRLA